ncbi:MAG: TolC family protein [Bacteroidetes bacterium]|nr:TolC family protein [Bacteroidota bacterium]
MLVNIHKHRISLLLFFAALVTGNVNSQVWTLQQCIDTALVNNKNLQISRNSSEIGDQRHKEARATLIPKVNVNADYRYYANLPYQFMPLSAFGGPDGQFKEVQFGVPHNINANLQLTMSLYNPQVYGAIQSTKIGAEISGLQVQKTTEQIFFEISNLYYNAQILNSQRAFIDSNLINNKKLLKNLQLLKEQLLAKGADVSKVQLQIDQLTNQGEIIGNKYEQVINALKFIMGISGERHIGIEPLSLYHPDNRDYKNASTIEFRLSEIQSKLLVSELRTLKNSRLPSLALYGFYGVSGFGYDKQPYEFLKFYPIGYGGLQLTYPLFNGSITQRKINQKKLEVRNSELQQSLITEQTNMQIDNARQQRLVAQHSLETTRSQIALGQSVYGQTILQQAQGTAGLPDVLLADNALREAQQNYLTAVVEYLKADLELKKLTGNILNK